MLNPISILPALVSYSLSSTHASPPVTLYGDSQCGQANSDWDRVLSGSEATLNEFPWQVLVQPSFPDGKDSLCGGVLLERDLVLTAAHCFCSKSADAIADVVTIRLGAHSRNSSLGTEEVKGFFVNQSVVIHPGYTNVRWSPHDLALIFLGHHLDLDLPRYKGTIGPICLPSLTTNFTGKEGLVSGWGSTKEHGLPSDVLMKALVEVVDHGGCMEQYNSTGYIVGEGIFCARGVGGADTCKGDSGGPLAVKEEASGHYMLVGVTKAGKGCGGLPGLYTSLQAYLPWVRSTVPRLIMLGGLPQASVLLPWDSECRMEDLPEPRGMHTLDVVQGNLLACGGKTTPLSCARWHQGRWHNMTLATRRWLQTSWLTPSGELLLVGGSGNASTTEVVWPLDQAGWSFHLAHPTSSSCSVAVGDTMVLTGGWKTAHLVTRYTREGKSEELAELLEGRWSHVCGALASLDSTVLIVAGGATSEGSYLASTELFTLGISTSWRRAASLPGPRYAMTSVVLRRELILLGGMRHDGEQYVVTKDILSYDPGWRLEYGERPEWLEDEESPEWVVIGVLGARKTWSTAVVVGVDAGLDICSQTRT